MTANRLALPFCLGLGACFSIPGPDEPLPFFGTWDCGVDTFTFTNTTYNNGSETYSMQSVSRGGSDFVLRFANGYTIALVAVTETGLTWVSGASGDQFNCRRV